MTIPLSGRHLQALERQLIHSEGLRLKPYRDTLGHLTIGIGHLLSKGISRDIVEALFAEDLDEAVTYLHETFPWTRALAAEDPLRYRVLVELAFNLGSKLGDFHATMRAAAARDWPACATHLEASRWFTQVGQRGPRLCGMLKTGQDPYLDTP